MTKSRKIGLVAGLIATYVCQGYSQQNLGLIGVKSIFGHYLQAHYPEGEMHASNDHRNEEETWFLIEVDKANHIYALQNWRNGKYMTRHGGCAPASSTVLGPSEQWIMVSGKSFGMINAVAFKSKADGAFLGTGNAGHDDNECGGEVGSRDSKGPVADGGWPGWWVIEQATAPSPGKDAWNTIGKTFQNIDIKAVAADVTAILTVVAAAGG